MDEYTPRNFDLAQLGYLCENLFAECQDNLDSHQRYQINDPTAESNLQLHELIEHIANFTLNYNLKYQEETQLTQLIDRYLDDSFVMFSNYSITQQDLVRWQASYDQLFKLISTESPGQLTDFTLTL